MAKRFTDTEIWDKEWFMNLKPKHKLLIKFIFDKCDVAGIWDANFTLASTYIGEKVSETDLNFFKTSILKISAGKFFIKDFIEFQYGQLSEKCKPHIKVISTLKKYNLMEGYTKGMERVEEKEEDKDKEKDMEEYTEKEEEKEGEEVFTDVKFPFHKFWDLYDKKVGDKEKLMRKWDALSNTDQETAMTNIPLYKLAEPDKQFRKNPETYLNNKSWNDEIIKKQDGKQPTQSKLASIQESANYVLEQRGIDPTNYLRPLGD